MNNHDDSEIIEQLYELVTSPGEYDAFMQSLESRLEGLAERNVESASKSGVLVAHLRRAAELLDVVTPWKIDTNPQLQEILDPKIQAMMIFDEGGIIVDANDAANVAYSLTHGATYLDLPFDVEDQATFLNAVRETVSGRVKRNSSNNVMRFQNQRNGGSALVTMSAHHVPETGNVLAIVKTSDIGWPPHLGPFLHDLFDLTPAEIEVVKMMLEGARVVEIAERRLISITTVRSQLRSIYTKTDTSGQIDCLRMVIGLSMMHDTVEGKRVAAQIQKAKATQFYPRDDQRRLLELSDGRRLDYAVFGAANGKPVLFYHCEVVGDTWFREAVETAIAMNLKIIAPLRPGFGQSTLHTARRNDPAIFASDVQELMDHLDVARAPVLAVCCGFVHGLATAALMPDRIVSVTATRPYLPVQSEAELAGFTSYTQLVQQVRLRFPQALRFVVKSGFAFVSVSGPIPFAKSLMRASPQDVAWVTRSDIAPLLSRSMMTHRYQGYQGTYSDLNYRGEWQHLLKDAPVPVRLLIGEHDNNVQRDRINAWASELAHVTSDTMPNSGYLVHHQHATQILKLIKNDLRSST